MDDFKFRFTKSVNQEKLTCEIYFQDECVGELLQEKNDFLIEIYPPYKSKFWGFKLENFQKALENAKENFNRITLHKPIL